MSSQMVIHGKPLDQKFAQVFGAKPEFLARAPGRVNLIGEHTDYNDGWVMPIAIDYDICILLRKRADQVIKLYSENYQDQDQFNLSDIRHAENEKSWSNYVRGVTDVLQKSGFKLTGMDALISGNIPQGAGLSSSAAMEMATITAFKTLAGLDIDPAKSALLCQRAENEFVGMRCGIMDQFISSLGNENHALLIDCRSLDYQLVPLPQGVSMVVVNSMVPHKLVNSAYNERREQCEAGAKALGVKALRDVSVEMFSAREKELPELTARRCRHVVTEDQRVLDSVEALKKGDLQKFGLLMNASHQSMRDWFEITVPEIDILVEIQQQQAGCFGARMTGGGFGGCTVALVRDEAVQSHVDVVNSLYPAKTGITPEVYILHAKNGANIQAL